MMRSRVMHLRSFGRVQKKETFEKKRNLWKKQIPFKKTNSLKKKKKTNSFEKKHLWKKKLAEHLFSALFWVCVDVYTIMHSAHCLSTVDRHLDVYTTYGWLKNEAV